MDLFRVFILRHSVVCISPLATPLFCGVPLVPVRSDAFDILTPSSSAVRLSTVPVIGRLLSFWKERIAARFASSTTPSIFPGSYPLVFKASSTFLISSFDNSTVPCPRVPTRSPIALGIWFWEASRPNTTPATATAIYKSGAMENSV